MAEFISSSSFEVAERMAGKDPKKREATALPKPVTKRSLLIEPDNFSTAVKTAETPLVNRMPGWTGTRDDGMDSFSNPEMARAQRRQDELNEGRTWKEAFAISNDYEMVSGAAARLWSRRNERDAEADFDVTEEMMDEFRIEFTDLERKYIQDSTSRGEWFDKIGHIRDDKKRNRDLDSMGKRGIAARMISGMGDPSGILLGMATGGGAWIAKGNRAMRMAKMAALAGTEGVAIESVIVAGDTGRDFDDVLIAGVASSALGMGIGALTRRLDPGMAKGIDELDEGLANDAKRALDADDEAAVAALRAESGVETRVKLDNASIARSIEDHVSTLRARAKAHLGGGRKGGKVRKDLNDRLRATKNELDDVKATNIAHRAKVAAKLGVTKGLRGRLDVIDGLYAKQIKKLENEVSQITKTLEADVEAKVANRELRTFEGKSNVQKVRQLYPEGAPRLAEQVAVQRKQIAKTVAKDAEEAAKKADIEARAPIDKEAAEAPEKPAERPEKPGDKVPAEGEKVAPASPQDVLDGIAEEVLSLPPSVIRYPVESVGDRIQGLFSTLDNSENVLIRGLAHRLFESPQGGHKAGQSASILSDSYGQLIRRAVGNRYNDGYFLWSKNQGRGLFRAALDHGDFRRQFDESVYLKLANPDLAVDKGVENAADGLRDGFSVALELRKRAGEAGFDKVKDTRKYVPVILDGNKFRKVNNSSGKDAIIDTMTEAYMTGRYNLKPNVARKLAEMQYVRTNDRSLSANHSFKSVISQAEQERFLDDLRKAGMEEDVIQEFIEVKEAKELLDNVSNRAKISAGMNVNAEVGGLRMVDLLNTHVAELSENYFREAAGGAAMAKNGFPTYHFATRVLDQAERHGLDNLKLDVQRSNIEIQMLHDGINMVYGKSIEANPRGGIERGSRRAREMTGLIMLQMVGSAQLPEASRAISLLGARNFFHSAKDVGIFSRRGIREGGTAFGQMKEPELRELEEIMGFIGESNFDTAVNVRSDDFGEGLSDGLWRLYDNATAHGMRVSTLTSGFQYIQGTIEKVTAKSIKNSILRMADTIEFTDAGKIARNTDTGGIKGLSDKHMEEIGWDDTFQKQLFTFIKENPAHAEYNGRQVRLLNFDKMDTQMQEQLMVGVNRLAGRLVQKNFVGDTSTWMNKWLGKTLTQFKTFSLVSAEKQLIHDIKGDKIVAAQILSLSAGLAAISYTAKHHLIALGESDPEEYLEKTMSTEALSWGIFNMLPQTAIVGMGGNAMAAVGLMPEPLMATSERYGGFREPSPTNMIPSVSLGYKALDVVNDIPELIAGSKDFHTVAQKARRIVPFGKTAGVGQAISAGINLTE
jgi:hypothetical protein